MGTGEIMSTPLRVHRGQKANERHAMRLQLVAAMVTSYPLWDEEGSTLSDRAASALVDAADVIIDALQSRLEAEKAGE
jgi:hypothetical protein